MNTKLRDALSSASMSQAELARRLGIHQSHVSRWLRRKLRPTGVQVLKAMGELGVSRPEDLGYSLEPAVDVHDYA